MKVTPTAIADVLGPAFDLSRFPATAKLFEDLRKEDSVAAKRAKATKLYKMRGLQPETVANAMVRAIRKHQAPRCPPPTASSTTSSATSRFPPTPIGACTPPAR